MDVKDDEKEDADETAPVKLYNKAKWYLNCVLEEVFSPFLAPGIF